MTILEILLIISPVLLEIIYDVFQFSRGKSDKPQSTIGRGVYMAIIAAAFHVFGVNTWYQTVILLVFTHLFLATRLQIFHGTGSRQR